MVSGGVSTGEVRPGVSVAVTCTFSCTTQAGIGGECVEVMFTLLKVPVMFRSMNVPFAPAGAASLDAMLTLLRFTFRMQDSGTPAMMLDCVAPVAVRSEMKIL